VVDLKEAATVFASKFGLSSLFVWGVDLQDTIRLITLTQTCYENAYNPKGATGKSQGTELERREL